MPPDIESGIESAVIWANLRGFGLGLAAGFLIGYAYAWHRAHAYAPMHMPRRKEEGDEVELFTTTTPAACPPGKQVQHDRALDGGQTTYVVTRLVDLGSFPDIYGQPHQQWRVYGRPA
jgi:hypothetical protein